MIVQTTLRRARSREDSGMTVVFFAIGISALLTIAALVLGGSTGYGAVRNSQTAADAASLAATAKLREASVAAVDPNTEADFATIAATAQSVAEDNGADPSAVRCFVVTAYYAVAGTQSEKAAQTLGPCDGSVEQHADAAGILVTVEETRSVPFGSFVNSDDITASARATSTIQPLGGWFRAPFMVCASGLHGVNPLTDVTPDDEEEGPWEVTEGAIGVEFLLWSHGNAFHSRNCDQEQWYGLTQFDGAFLVPSPPEDPDGWWKIEPGSKVGHIPDVSGRTPCEAKDEEELGNLVGCEIPVPLCVDTAFNGQNARLNCVMIATFLITYYGDGSDVGSCVAADVTGNKEVLCGKLLKGRVSTGGQGQLGQADPNELVTINLVE